MNKALINVFLNGKPLLIVGGLNAKTKTINRLMSEKAMHRVRVKPSTG
ncbi:MAG: hypothetical protein ACUVQ0_06220 [Thermoproteota archaeon]